MKSLVIKWDIDRKATIKQYLCHIELEVDRIFSLNRYGLLNFVDKMRIDEREGNKLEIFKKDEATWHQKSWAL